MGFRIKEIFVEYQREPLGLDEREPRFSWVFEADERGMRQGACRVVVSKRVGDIVVWDSGRLECGESRGIAYAGEALEACTAYRVLVRVWDGRGMEACGETFFETGLMNFSADEEAVRCAWGGAEWIAAPRYSVCARARGVFVLESELRLENGKGRAGVVFGADVYKRQADKVRIGYGYWLS